MTRTGCNINFTADDRLDTSSMCFGVEVQSTKHVAMIGDGHGRHAILTGTGHQITNTNSTIKQAVLGVDMEVNKIGMMHVW